MRLHGFFYVALKNNFGVTIYVVTMESTTTSSPEWIKVNEEFEKRLVEHDDHKVFSNKIFKF